MHTVTYAEKICLRIVILAYEGGMANGIESLTCIDIDWHSWHSCFTGGQGYMPKGRNLAPHLLSCVMGFLPLSVSNPVVYWLVACNWVIKWGQGCSTKLISNSVGRKQEVPHKLPDPSLVPQCSLCEILQEGNKNNTVHICVVSLTYTHQNSKIRWDERYIEPLTSMLW